MMWLALSLAGIAALPAFEDGKDYPHRDWGQVATLDMTVAEATACIARALDKGGSVLVLPVEGGNDIDYSIDVPWGKRPDAWERFKLRSDGAATTMRLFYRHPVSQKGAGKDVARLQKQCLRVSRIEPVTPS